MNPIQNKRQGRGLTIPQAARLAGVSDRTWENAEKGHDCQRNTKRRMLKALRVPFNRNGEFFPMEPYSRARFTKLLLEAHDLIARGLTEAQNELAGAPNLIRELPPLVWSLQGFGMLRYYMPGTSQRLHVWSPDHAEPGVTAMHSHPWNFYSTVLSGELTNEIYTMDNVVGDSEPYYRQTIECGEDGGLVGNAERVWVGLQSVALYTPGQRYRQEAPQIHVSKPTRGCVTVCKREPIPGANLDHARVYWPDSQVWGSAEPRTATAHERESILGYAIRHWGSN